MELKIARFLVNEIVSRAFYTSNHSDTSGDMLDNFYKQIQANWEGKKSNWKSCLHESLPAETTTDMIKSGLSALLPEKFNSEIYQVPENMHQYVESTVKSRVLWFFNCTKIYQAEALELLSERIRSVQVKESSKRGCSIGKEQTLEFLKQRFRHSLQAQTESSPTETKGTSVHRFCSDRRYGPQMHPDILQLTSVDETIQFLNDFVLDVCLSVLYFSVCMKMDNSVHDIPVWSCVSCRQMEVQVLLLPCQHRCMCEACYKGLLKHCPNNFCPMCRQPIRDAVRLNRSTDASE